MSQSNIQSEFQNTLNAAMELDKNDTLKHYRKRFLIPQHEGKDVVYFTGNSLGLQPRTTLSYLQQELNDWAEFGVEGHFLAKNPWLSYHELLTDKMAKIVGALPKETVMMNQLTVNLHLLLVSFYRPTKTRFKILCEAKAFPSDQYALQSQIKFHGHSTEEALIEVAPREGEYHIREEDIFAAIEKNKDSLALIMIGGVNYFTGQVFDMKAITQAGHKAGAVVGFDLAHGAGNIKLQLHDWNVDFAAWCSYKYLNSGPGSVAGAFVHEKHLSNLDLPLFAGWWGHDKKTRFLMDSTFVPMQTAERWQMSNAPIFSMAACRASLDIFDEVGMDALIEKSQKLLAYLEFIVNDLSSQKKDCLQIITPKENRGCQLSIVAHGYGKKLYNALIENGVVPDWREPNVIRCAAIPLYNSFEDMYRFGEILKRLL
ncbi:kynureninase [Aurantibacillus circumpalustris]|uniref:kynureninase n=1 Tax=Aurantibacillus circumpalustris TaxID=3036359 RepID=UPI00295BF288|nr:kynureninase [Aurantibacillus circumpalustris]